MFLLAFDSGACSCDVSISSSLLTLQTPSCQANVYRCVGQRVGTTIFVVVLGRAAKDGR